MAQTIREYLSEIGRRGGEAKVKKGLGSLTAERRKEIQMQGVEARKNKRAGKTRKASARAQQSEHGRGSNS